MPPSLETGRLVLRPHALADFEDSFAMWSDPEVTRHIGGKPLTREDVWARLLRYHGHWQLLGFGYWVARDKASGRFVGEAGFAEWRRELVPPLDAPEAGWALARWAQGRGLATEAMQAALSWADARFERTVCLIEPGHAASLRVAEKVGYLPLREARYRGERTLVLARARARPAPDGAV